MVDEVAVAVALRVAAADPLALLVAEADPLALRVAAACPLTLGERKGSWATTVLAMLRTEKVEIAVPDIEE